MQLAIVPPFSVALEPGEQVLPVADGKETTSKSASVQTSPERLPGPCISISPPDGGTNLTA